MKDETINGYNTAERKAIAAIGVLHDLERKATRGNWQADHDSSAPECGEYVYLDEGTPGHRSLFDTAQSEFKRIEQDDDDGVHYEWDAQGRANMRFVAAIRNAAPHLLDEAAEAVVLRQRIRELRDALGKIVGGYSAPVDLAEYALEADRKAEAGECPF